MPATALKEEAKLSHRMLFGPAFIATAAFVLRYILLLWIRRGADGASMPYVNETTGIARSIASGHGFASPFPLAHTGATAWVCPVFPYLIAGIFRVWGTFSEHSLLVIQILNCLFASLVIFFVYDLAKRMFGPATASAASWLWVLLPFAWWTPIQDIWDTSLTALILVAIFWATFVIPDRNGWLAWVGYGVLWSVGALVNAAVLSILPFFFGWLFWQRLRHSLSLARLFASLVACILLLIPWTVRNRQVLGKWIPLRSNFGMELWLGNNPEARDPNSFALHPLWNASEAAKFQRMGEINYIAAKQRAAVDYMRAHPGKTLRAIAGRIWSNWFAVTDRVNPQWTTSPVYVKVLFVANFFMVLFGALGLASALRENACEALPYLIVVLVFPLPYYLTHTLVRYRFPIEPILTILAAYGVSQSWTWMKQILAGKRAGPLLKPAR